MALVVKLVLNQFVNESRDLRELSVIKELGHDVIVVAKGSHNYKGSVEGFDVHYRTTRPLGQNKLIRKVNVIFALFTWALYVRRLKPKSISCHDVTALLIGWISTWFTFKKNRTLLVYDSHEFEIGRNTQGKRSKLVHLYLLKLEKFLIGKSVFSIMVNDSIADEVQKMYRLKTRPIVVRNIPKYWEIDRTICEEKRNELCDTFNFNKNHFMVMYHGAITLGRGIENLISAVAKIEDINLVILGFADESYLNDLKNLIKEVKIEHRVGFVDAVPNPVLWKYVGAVDLGAITIPNICTSYYYMLPNKLFENIQSETPIIGSNFPEVKRIVDAYKVGLYCDPHDVNEITSTIIKIKEDKALYQSLKEHIKFAKKELCWENEKQTLVKAYQDIL